MAGFQDLQDPAEIARLLLKRKLWLIAAATLGLALAALKLVVTTPLYYASTLVMVEPQKVPSEYVKTTVTSILNDRLRTLEEQVESRPAMESLITDLEMYKEVWDVVPMEALVARAKENLSVRVERGRIVEIGFSGKDPVMAARATNRVAELFIEENLRTREKQAQNTTAFIDAELERTKFMLEQQETKVSEYHLDRDGSLPSQRQANLSAIAQLERQFEQNNNAIEDAELRRLLLDQEMGRAVGSTASGQTTNQSDKEKRLELLEIELQELRSQYTEQHPDVVRLRAEIEMLETQLEQEGDRTASTESGVKLVEPVSSAQMEVDILNRELERLGIDNKSILSEMARYQRRLEQMPITEQGLISLTRDYDNLERFYQSLLAKQVEARMAEQLERQQQSEQFKILEPALPPSIPFYPNRAMTMILGLVLGAGFGVGIILAVETLDQTFTDELSLQRAFPMISCIVAIPLIDVAGDEGKETEASQEQKTA